MLYKLFKEVFLESIELVFWISSRNLGCLKVPLTLFSLFRVRESFLVFLFKTPVLTMLLMEKCSHNPHQRTPSLISVSSLL